MINGHGNNLQGIQHLLKADFSTNVFDNPQTDGLLDYLQTQIPVIRNYPDPECRILREKLATTFKISPEHVLVTNGSTESFYLLAHAFQQQCSAIRTPAFAEYEDACTLHKHQIVFVDELQELNSSTTADLVWIGNPNNPDGRYRSPQELIAFLRQNPKRLLVVDEAYIDLCEGAETVAPLVSQYPNLVVIKSFTKLFAIPGIRIGYLLADPSIIHRLQACHMPWAVNALALKAGEYILDLPEKPTAAFRQRLNESKRLQTELAQLPGLKVFPSPTNYFLCQLQQATAAELKTVLLEKHGFLIRDASNFRGLGPGHFRIAAQNKTINNEFISALRASINVLQPCLSSPSH
ncbi:threonine-phosphate decarboxylase [Mangrovibacterium diazotrophicum]|uniref:Aminotransferase n=1 Tax=Mangrovibacterium diazotrophicum TaxID=1261403 RepID=A0A419W4M8_9BACT|nr:threonine-phosphate decarboxylase [Mangrovibacterium diazotrophicum]RKD90392.1 threonine-phosphate decarboxylase [Mangrovibacterium diazotrophicum]